jgi:xanthine dehydrogenase YagS FAD-binding subunit
LELRRASSVEDVREGELVLAGGTEVVPLLRSGLVQAQALVMVGSVVPRGVSATRIGAGAPLAQLECDPEIPDVLREA